MVDNLIFPIGFDLDAAVERLRRIGTANPDAIRAVRINEINQYNADKAAIAYIRHPADNPEDRSVFHRFR